MKIINQIVVALFLLTSIANTYAQNERTVNPFDEIAVTGNIDVILQQGDTEKLEIDAEGIPEDKVVVRVSNGTLRLKLLNSIFYKNDKVTIKVTYKTLRSVKGIAGANIESSHPIEADKLVARAGSVALLELEVKTNALDITANEGGVLRVEGETDTQNASATTGGHIKALDLDSNRTYVKANTGGHAEVVAHQFIEATANTGGRVEYKGNPAESNTKTLMSGGVRKL